MRAKKISKIKTTEWQKPSESNEWRIQSWHFQISLDGAKTKEQLLPLAVLRAVLLTSQKKSLPLAVPPAVLPTSRKISLLLAVPLAVLPTSKVYKPFHHLPMEISHREICEKHPI